MNITICNFKGGVGKSMIAHQLITGFGYSGVEVDPYGDLAQRLPGKVAHVPLSGKLAKGVENTVFDFGGFDDKKIVEAAGMSDLLLVPFIPTPESMQGTVKTVNRLKSLDRPILFVANMAQKPGDVEDAAFVFREILETEAEIFSLPLSVALQTAIFENRSVLELAEQTGLKKFAYKKAAGVMEALHKTIREYA